jgi:hypothetical protein
MSCILQNIRIFSESPEGIKVMCIAVYYGPLHNFQHPWESDPPGYGRTSGRPLPASHTNHMRSLLLERTAEFHEKLWLPDEMSKILLLLVTSWPGRPWPLYCSPLHCWHVYHVALWHVLTSRVKLIISHVTWILFRSQVSNQSLERRR